MTTPDSTSQPLEAGLLEAMANEFFRGAMQDPSGDLGASVPLSPPVPGAVPAAAIAPPNPAIAPRLAPAPPVSAVGSSHPVPALPGAHFDVPRVPLLPETAAPPGAKASVVDTAPLATPGRYEGIRALDSYAFVDVPVDLFPLAPSAQPIAVREPIPQPATSQSFHPVLVPQEDRKALAFHTRPDAGFDPHVAKRDFPLLKTQVHGKPLVWLDNAATTQKPQAVLDRLIHFYEHENSNIHRAAHELAARATDAYEGAREAVRRFINAPSTSQVIFVRGTTEGINLIAKSWGAANIGAGDEIIVTHLEHHANIVPWQQLCESTGAVLRVAPVDDSGDVILEEFAALFGPRTKLVSFTQVSNALGTVTPAPAMIGIAHSFGVPVLLDAAQGIAHARVDVQALDVDFLVFSGHKIYGPTGIGVVYGKRELLEGMPPWEGGGNMIADVTFERTVFHGPPARFEAGTGNIADAVGLGAALDYVSSWGIDAISAYEHGLMDYLVAQLESLRGVRILGRPAVRAGAVSLVVEGRESAEVGKALDREGIAVRSGHHCAQPILRRFGVENSVRPSLALYNTTDDVDALVRALARIIG